MAQKKVLIVDDEPKITAVVRLYLEKEGFLVSTASDGKQAVQRTDSYGPDLIILDLNLPDMDGLEVCRTLRAKSDVPIIMLTGRGEEINKIVGFETGADDYVTKPFSPRELVARTRAVLRRRSPGTSLSQTVVAGDLVIDAVRFEARCKGNKVDLTATEFKLLHVLAQSPGRVYTRTQLLDHVQGDAFDGYERTIDAHIKNIRQKITHSVPTHSCRIETVRGVGYKLEVDPSEV
ncbi:MAG: response regulator transcription factor [Chloroflexi bacterium]|nr:response regulator transcription factor [Chloroflexota bacterium]